jgi:hypothetical protein
MFKRHAPIDIHRFIRRRHYTRCPAPNYFLPRGSSRQNGKNIHTVFLLAHSWKQFQQFIKSIHEKEHHHFRHHQLRSLYPFIFGDPGFRMDPSFRSPHAQLRHALFDLLLPGTQVGQSKPRQYPLFAGIYAHLFYRHPFLFSLRRFYFSLVTIRSLFFFAVLRQFRCTAENGSVHPGLFRRIGYLYHHWPANDDVYR